MNNYFVRRSDMSIDPCCPITVCHDGGASCRRCSAALVSSFPELKKLVDAILRRRAHSSNSTFQVEQAEGRRRP